MTDDPIDLFASARPDASRLDLVAREALWAASIRESTARPDGDGSIELTPGEAVAGGHRRRRVLVLAVAAVLAFAVLVVTTNRNPGNVRDAAEPPSTPIVTPESTVAESSSIPSRGRTFVPPDCSVPRSSGGGVDKRIGPAVRIHESIYIELGDVLPATAAGPVLARVCSLDDGGPLDDGDAPFPAGTPIHEVVGYNPLFRVGVVRGDRLDVFELYSDPTALRGADMLDLSSGVIKVEFHTADVDSVLFELWQDERVGRLVTGVEAALVASDAAEIQGSPFRLVFVLRDGTTVQRVYDPASGRLDGLQLDGPTRELLNVAPPSPPPAGFGGEVVTVPTPDLGAFDDPEGLVAALEASGPLDNETASAIAGKTAPAASICADIVHNAEPDVGVLVHQAVASYQGEVGVILVLQRSNGTRHLRLYSTGAADPATGGCRLLLASELPSG